MSFVLCLFCDDLKRFEFGFCVLSVLCLYLITVISVIGVAWMMILLVLLTCIGVVQTLVFVY